MVEVVDGQAVVVEAEVAVGDVVVVHITKRVITALMTGLNCHMQREMLYAKVERGAVLTVLAALISATAVLSVNYVIK